MEKAALLKELGFSDEFIKLIEEDDNTTDKTIIVRDLMIIDPLQNIKSKDLTELIIEKTDPPLSRIVSTR